MNPPILAQKLTSDCGKIFRNTELPPWREITPQLVSRTTNHHHKYINSQKNCHHHDHHHRYDHRRHHHNRLMPLSSMYWVMFWSHNHYCQRRKYCRKMRKKWNDLLPPFRTKFCAGMKNLGMNAKHAFQVAISQNPNSHDSKHVFQQLGWLVLK